MNDNTRFTDGAAVTDASSSQPEANFREMIDTVVSGKWVVLAIVVLSVAISVIYAMTVQPVYRATGLIQVEIEESNKLNKAADQLSSLIGSSPTQAPAEIAIIKSRMVLGAVVDSLKLYISARPNYAPIFGQAIARRRNDIALPAPDFDFLQKYAWGGESITVTALEIPQALYNQTYTLVAKSDGYDFLDPNGDILFSGLVGVRASVVTPLGPFSIFVQSLTARPGATFSITRLALQTALDALQQNFAVVEAPHDSGMLNLTLDGTNPVFAAQLINEIEDAYLRQNVERKSAQAEQSLEFLKKQLPELKGKVDEAQAQLNSYQLRKGTVDLQKETSLILQKIVDLETLRMQAVQERDAALQRYTDQHPVVATLNEQIRGLERELGGFKKQVGDLPETQQEILSLMRDVEVNTGLYTGLLNSAQELQVTKAGTVGNVRIIDYGLVPLIPIKPQKRAIVTLGILVGVFLGLLSVFGARALLRGVDRPEEVERATGLPTYASIPYSRQQKLLGGFGKSKRDTGGLLATIDNSDIAIEALRSLRTSLHFAMLEASNNIVMLTGPTASLGKSFVSVNLGAVLAMSGKKIVVVDADMRRGHMHRHVKLQNKPGLSDYVAGTADETQVIRSTEVANLSMVTCGSRPPNPSEVLMSERFNNLLKLLSSRYDYVIIDTPPVIPVTDAAIVGRLAGSTLVILKSAEHPMRAIQETIKRLRQAGVQVKGMIFNQVGARMGSFGYGEYGVAYGYSTKGYSAKPPK